MILATKSSTPIIGQLATLMGFIMNLIYKGLSAVGIHNISLCIIIFSIIIYLCMTPLQIKQQKFSKLSAVMQPELQKVQAKYKGKKDQASMQKMQEETSAVYAKYGVSPTGSCVQLLIQMPILFALYQVIYKIPAYVGSVKDILMTAVDKIVAVDGFVDIVNNFIATNGMARVSKIAEGAEITESTKNILVDFLYNLTPDQWKSLASMKEFSGASDVINNVSSQISEMQGFFGLNIANNPLFYVKAVVAGGSIVLAIVAILIPFLSWLTQMINIKLMPQAGASDNGEPNQMANSMKTVNNVMPLMSAFFCVTFPVGLGLYWIASAVVRSVQQFFINRHLDKIDMNDLINENMKKYEKKREKQGLPPQKITNQAHQSAKNIKVTIDKGQSNAKVDERAAKIDNAYKNAEFAKPGSITAKANMVKAFNERQANSKK